MGKKKCLRTHALPLTTKSVRGCVPNPATNSGKVSRASKRQSLLLSRTRPKSKNEQAQSIQTESTPPSPPTPRKCLFVNPSIAYNSVVNLAYPPPPPPLRPIARPNAQHSTPPLPTTGQLDRAEPGQSNQAEPLFLRRKITKTHTHSND